MTQPDWRSVAWSLLAVAASSELSIRLMAAAAPVPPAVPLSLTAPAASLIEAPAVLPYPQRPAIDYLPAIAPVATHVVLRLGERRLYVYDQTQVLSVYPVAIGAPETPTPTGEFEIFQMVENPRWQSPWTGEVYPPGPESALGLRWIGFAQRPEGVIGFHGTPTLASIGAAASNGCVRLRNQDVVALFEQVRLGMPVIVEP